MQALIGKHLNVNPIGLGNNTIDINMDSYRTGKGGGDDSSEKLDVEMEVEELEKELVDDEIDEEDVDELVNKGKAQSDGAEQANGKTAACPGKSKPTSHAPKEQKKKRKLEDFAEVTEAGEVTHQKELELAKAMVDKDRAKLKVKAAEMAYKMQKLQDKIAKRKERAKEKASKLRLLEYCQTQGFTMPSILALPTPYNRHHTPLSLFQDFNHTANPQHPATSSSNHYYGPTLLRLLTGVILLGRLHLVMMMATMVTPVKFCCQDSMCMLMMVAHLPQVVQPFQMGWTQHLHSLTLNGLHLHWVLPELDIPINKEVTVR